jgi:hypothetical protein
MHFAQFGGFRITERTDSFRIDADSHQFDNQVFHDVGRTLEKHDFDRSMGVVATPMRGSGECVFTIFDQKLFGQSRALDQNEVIERLFGVRRLLVILDRRFGRQSDDVAFAAFRCHHGL